MSKFNTLRARAVAHAPIVAVRDGNQRTYEGAPAAVRDTKSELFVLAVAAMIAEDTFYERASDRDQRLTDLVAHVALDDPRWIARFVPWLRSQANMRSASLVVALTAAHAINTMTGCHTAGCSHPVEAHDVHTGQWSCCRHRSGASARVNVRGMVASALQRPDEPGEALAYWLSRHGRRLPMGVKRGIADAARTHYTQRNALKYDTGAHGIRFADVIELCHPRPLDDVQSDLFTWLLDRRPGARRKCGGKRVAVPESLTMVAAATALRRSAQTDAAALADAATVHRAGISWEEQLSTGGSRVDKAALWEAKIPTMGYMALLRNLKNFDQAGVSGTVAAHVAQRLADPDEVAASQQFPLRFLAAWRHAPSLRWAQALETALAHSLANVPSLTGRTLILVDRSGSMFTTASGHGSVQLADIAAVFGAALALRAEHARLVQYGTHSAVIRFAPGVASLLRVVDRFAHMGGTNTAAAVDGHYAGHDRVIIITDEQASGTRPGWGTYATRAPGDLVPDHVPVYTWNLGGYRWGHDVSGGGTQGLRYTFAGLTDHAWSAIDLIEAGRSQRWPF